ncbi:MAG: hypothetical protein DWB56_07885 [Candidatus Jettenia sp.]|uniref:hypothetical protein n=1 Tax=Candidatus Jettenia sp. AMX1 TaxID=2293637 RepID=UPI00058E0365|nr:hypothetical protein [Candidatus Jettenia sp. AMX1]MBC6928865.1 hypothetical protein [Candidatus Jettenia sp.]KAA0250890.1 MAG: hypothetical protein EDM77_03530 [Candidatus Jettenia sp. AMX1]MCE7879867.1 hypothetical protein [Candidatus Jettenia sp. AMX1]MCQ3926646.1 hypothetical protein [Candidatus Jettenia sp.]MDL1938454.1 hypothetical protein [Candidatus Jettenia sp. AMX1]
MEELVVAPTGGEYIFNPQIQQFPHIPEKMIGNCLFSLGEMVKQKRRDCKLFSFFWRKNGGRIFPGCSRISVLTNSYVIICTNFVLKLIQKIEFIEMNGIDITPTIP